MAGGRCGNRLYLSCWSGGLRMKPLYHVLVPDHPGHSGCAGFLLALNNSKESLSYVRMVSLIVHITMNYNRLGGSAALHWCGLKSWKHLYIQKMPVFPDSITAAQWLVHLSKGGTLHEWLCYLKTWRSLVLHEEARVQMGKRVHDIRWKPLAAAVSLVSLQKFPCLHSSHRALVTICEQHFEDDFSKPSSACAFQTLILSPQ